MRPTVTQAQLDQLTADAALGRAVREALEEEAEGRALACVVTPETDIDRLAADIADDVVCDVNPAGYLEDAPMLAIATEAARDALQGRLDDWADNVEADREIRRGLRQ